MLASFATVWLLTAGSAAPGQPGSATLRVLVQDQTRGALQLKDLAGPGAQIFVDGFRGGRLPPKDQILQIRFQTNSFAAEYHDAGMVRIEIITKPGMGAWRGATNVGFRDDALDARNAFAPTRGAERQQRFMANFAGPLRRGKTSLAIAADGIYL
jgi:hypothetical protein